MGKIETSVLYLPRPAKKYPGCYPLYFEKRLSEMIGTKDFIHVFSGMADKGIRIDIRSQVEPDVVADAQNLPFAENTFDGGMADPPYTPKFAKELYGVEYPKWGKWTNEIVRVVKPGCRIGIMQNYIVPRLINCVYEEIVVILLRIKQFPKVVTLQRKMMLQISLAPAAVVHSGDV
jgi:hypothetical protein